VSITLELSDELTADVSLRAKQAGKTRDEFIAEVLRRQLAMERFRETRARLESYGEAAGLQTDEAVFDAVS
jgi:hypothetical protein